MSWINSVLSYLSKSDKDSKNKEILKRYIYKRQNDQNEISKAGTLNHYYRFIDNVKDVDEITYEDFKSCDVYPAATSRIFHFYYSFLRFDGVKFTEDKYKFLEYQYFRYKEVLDLKEKDLNRVLYPSFDGKKGIVILDKYNPKITPFLSDCIIKKPNNFKWKEVYDLVNNNINKSFNNVKEQDLIKLLKDNADMFIGNDTCISLFRDIYSYFIDNSEAFRNSVYDYPLVLIKKIDFARSLKAGYIPVHYNIQNDPPEENKWFLFPGELAKNTTRASKSTIYNVDFSIINPLFINEFKSFLWFGTVNVHSIVMNINKYAQFLNTFKIKAITIEDCIKYNSYVGDIGFNSYIRSLLNFFSEETDIKVENGATNYLDIDMGHRSNKPVVLTKEQKESLIIYIKNHKHDNDTMLAFYYIVLLSLNVEFRFSSICILTTDCLSKNSDGLYTISTRTKTSKGNTISSPCSTAVADIIGKCLKDTNSFRCLANDKTTKEHLFIKRDKRGNVIPITNDSIETIFHKLSIEIFGEPKSIGCLRDTCLNRYEDIAKKERIDDRTLISATGHQSVSMLRSHYIDNKIKTSLEATYNTFIGNIDIKGQITRDANLGKQHLVEHGCGYCRTECAEDPLMKCLRCRYFIATVNNLPAFKQRILEIDKKISAETEMHNKRTLQAEKALLVAYMEGILKCQQKSN